MATIESINLISIDPKVRGGRPCVAGTGLRVTDVVMATLFHQRKPGEIASDYEISLAQVHAALAYYYQHQTDLDADIRQQIETARELKEKRIGMRRRLPIGQPVKITYDPSVDTLYIQLTNAPVARGQSDDSDFNLDYASEGNVRGIEILYTSDRGIVLTGR